MADITYIPIRQLYPHPDNPRKELGDLTELAASIKENGVYQNLTVIPGHYLGKQEHCPVHCRWRRRFGSRGGMDTQGRVVQRGLHHHHRTPPGGGRAAGWQV